MHRSHRFPPKLLGVIAALAFTVAFISTSLALAAPPPPEGSQGSGQIDPQIEQAFQNSQYGVHTLLPNSGISWKIDHVVTSGAGTEAVAWLAPIDAKTGEVIATELTPAVARKVSAKGELSVSGAWSFIMPGQDGWEAGLRALPDELDRAYIEDTVLAPEEKTIAPQAVTTVFSGYKLPWAKSLGKSLSGSIGHFLIYNSCSIYYCRYAYDFFDQTNFPLLAAKGGVVYFAKWGCANNDHYCTNELVLKDESTTPVTYQIYMHMEHDSIPSELRTTGALVRQGQYIGNVDNTGYSSGAHLHFMVVADPYMAYTSGGDHYIWGHSLDVTFSDVSVNGGRPRTCYEAANWPSYGTQCMPNNVYVSANQGTDPPVGDLLAPDNGTVVTSSNFVVGGWAKDDRGVTKLQVVANYDGIWRTIITPAFNAPQKSVTFGVPLDLCAAGVPDGPVSLALYAWDLEGNRSLGLAGLRQIYNDACHQPVPPCTPSADQIGIYAQPNFTGACKVLGKGNYPDTSYFNPISSGNIASIQVGANVQATLYLNNSYVARPETYRASDRNLADNRTGARISTDPNLSGAAVGAGTVGSLKVEARQSAPNPPGLDWPANGEPNLYASSSLHFYWHDMGGATEFQAELYVGGASGTPYKTLDWTDATAWYLGTVPWTTNTTQTYTWRVRARNENGVSDWSTRTFTISQSLTYPSPTLTAPTSNDFEGDTSNWYGGQSWHITTRRADSGAHSFWMGEDSTGTYAGLRESGLTSPGINIPNDGNAYYLRFNYWAKTEGPGTLWDARLVQISQDGGTFENVLQLSDDQPARGWISNDWHASPVIDLSKYAGHWIRVRFQFFSGDTSPTTTSNNLNNFEGWYVDDFSISTDPPAACNTPEEPNNDPAHATSAAYGNVFHASICPAGDVDYYRFDGKLGENISAEVKAKALNPVSDLDATLVLLDSDGRTVLAENDDEIPGQLQDSLINFVLPADGEYYLAVKDFSHPGTGGAGYFYDLSLKRISSDSRPEVSLDYPYSYSFMGQHTPLIVSTDSPNGPITKVEFYYHNSDWESGSWSLVGTDTNGADGWSALLDTTKQGEGSCAGNNKCPAVFVKSYDSSGSWRGAIAWDLGVDNTPPTSTLSALPAQVYSGAIQIKWSGSDALSGLGSFDVQVSQDGGAWQAMGQGHFPAGTTKAWFIGAPGHSYRFRVRAIDRAGNAQDFPANAQASTTIAASCANDGFENDNSRENAKPMALGSNQAHTFCSGDEDWVKFTPEAGKKYMIWGLPQSGSTAAPDLALYDPDGNLILTANSLTDVAGSAIAWWTAPDNRTYTLQARPHNANVVGSDVKYVLRVGDGSQYFLPLIGR